MYRRKKNEYNPLYDDGYDKDLDGSYDDDDVDDETVPSAFQTFPSAFQTFGTPCIPIPYVYHLQKVPADIVEKCRFYYIADGSAHEKIDVIKNPIPVQETLEIEKDRLLRQLKTTPVTNPLWWRYYKNLSQLLDRSQLNPFSPSAMPYFASSTFDFMIP